MSATAVKDQAATKDEAPRSTNPFSVLDLNASFRVRRDERQKAVQAVDAARDQVTEVVDIMKTNVARVLERDVNLLDLDRRASALQIGASQFETRADKLQRKFFFANMKGMLIIGLVVLLFIIGLLFWIF